VSDLLDRAGALFDGSDFVGALACAEEAARQAPRSVEAHHDRAAALVHLDRLDDARDALAVALALDPDDPETLEASADLYVNQLPPSADRSAIGLEYARQALRRIGKHRHGDASRVILLEAQALIDLGRASEGLQRLDRAMALDPTSVPVQYERGVSLFELCRFQEARKMFQRVLALRPDHSHALYHLGLVEERIGSEKEATAKLAMATAQDPKAFPPVPDVSSREFAELVERVVRRLPTDVQEDLKQAHVEAAELPALDDLTAEKPPLSPTILGLFRGLPLGWERTEAPELLTGRSGKQRNGRKVRTQVAGPQAAPAPGARAGQGPGCAAPPERTIILFRRNLLRTVRSVPELEQAIERTLLHEIGHLRGEDDGSLRDRGLE
jgi:tetratricopeptide (TPR) repeat protein